MKNNSSFSQHIDQSVILTMAVWATVASVVLAFRYKNYAPCTAITIAVKPGPVYAGELIQFKAVTYDQINAANWVFSDKNGQYQPGLIVNHTFELPGRYEVTLTTDQGCYDAKTIYVREAPPRIDNPSKPHFKGPQTAIVGLPATFQDATPNAHQWEWRFGETNRVDATTRKASYVYTTPGTKKVILIVNGIMHGELTVLVTPRPVNGIPTSHSKPSPPKRPRKVNEELLPREGEYLYWNKIGIILK